MSISVIFEDDDLLVLAKPSGVTVNTSDTTTGEKTLQNLVEEYRNLTPFVRPEKMTPLVDEKGEKIYKSSEQEFNERAGIVHRLDKETSGVILVAKNTDAFQKLQAQFKERTVEKTYIALAHGKIMPLEGEINAPVGRLPWNRKHFGVLSGGREALTLYKVIKEYPIPDLSLVELSPKTGRTHQIRVHLQYIKHPIFADFLYAGRKVARDDRQLLSRVFLHASTISFTHPKTNKQMFFTAPLPEELQRVLNQLEI